MHAYAYLVLCTSEQLAAATLGMKSSKLRTLLLRRSEYDSRTMGLHPRAVRFVLFVEIIFISKFSLPHTTHIPHQYWLTHYDARIQPVLPPKSNVLLDRVPVLKTFYLAQ